MELDRFVAAQDHDEIYDHALAELRAGHKTSHWMWFVFPQVAGLGRSALAQTYALADLAEARAYLAHDVLGPRLIECCRALLALEGRSAEQMFGREDAKKLLSSMTLFALADPRESLYADVRQRYYDGASDQRTVALLG